MPTYRTGVILRDDVNRDSRLAIAKVLMDLPPDYWVHDKLPASKLLEVVDFLLAGGTLIVEHTQRKDCEPWEDCSYFVCHIETVHTEYEAFLNEREDRFKKYEALRVKGAGGDAQAAIEFCQIDPEQYAGRFAAYA